MSRMNPRLRDGVPAFVTRGLMTLGDPRDISTVRYANEADLRDAMALSWWLAGWRVRTEVKVPDCGRIDVLAEAREHTVVIELKKQIETPGQARSAFQQAHTYASYLTAGNAHGLTTCVTAGAIESRAVHAASRAFPFVDWGDFLSVAGWATRTPNVDQDFLARIARNRRDELANLADLAATAAAVATNRAEMRIVGDIA